MAAIDTTRSALGSASVALRPGAWIAHLSARARDWNDQRMTRKSLGALTDRELADIGLIRGDIDAVATDKR